MESTTAQRAGLRGLRRPRLLAVAGLAAASAAAATVIFSGSAAASPFDSVSGGKVAGTPCRTGVNACVQVGPQGFNGRAWYIQDDRVVRGPVPVATGGPGKDTSIGTFPVTSKDAHHVSSETRNAEGNPSEMPYSVFFGTNGEAFHGGGSPQARTAGCVRLRSGDDSYFYNHLQKGDRVQVVGRSAVSAPGGRNDDDRRDDNRDDNGNNNNGNKGGVLGGLLGGL